MSTTDKTTTEPDYDALAEELYKARREGRDHFEAQLKKRIPGFPSDLSDSDCLLLLWLASKIIRYADFFPSEKDIEEVRYLFRGISADQASSSLSEGHWWHGKREIIELLFEKITPDQMIAQLTKRVTGIEGSGDPKIPPIVYLSLKGKWYWFRFLLKNLSGEQTVEVVTTSGGYDYGNNSRDGYGGYNALTQTPRSSKDGSSPPRVFREVLKKLDTRQTVTAMTTQDAEGRLPLIRDDRGYGKDEDEDENNYRGIIFAVVEKLRDDADAIFEVFLAKDGQGRSAFEGLTPKEKGMLLEQLSPQVRDQFAARLPQETKIVMPVQTTVGRLKNIFAAGGTEGDGAGTSTPVAGANVPLACDLNK